MLVRRGSGMDYRPSFVALGPTPEPSVAACGSRPFSFR
jgi:hypothetical protein